MKAVICDKRTRPGDLVMREVEQPTCQPNEVLVRIEATSLNTADYRSLQLGIIPRRKIFGADIAGQVVECGEHVHELKVGDYVFGDLSGCGFGGLAEYVAAPESMLAHIPAGVSFQEAAAVPIAAVTALQALRDLGKLQAGHQVLVYGAGGGVGHFAVQLARYFGAEVTAVCSARNTSMMKALGAEHVIDYAKEDGIKTGRRFDLVLAVNGSRPIYLYKRILTQHGIIVLVGGGYAQVVQGLLFSWLLSIGDKKFRFLAAKPNPEDLEFLIRLVEGGKIKPVIDRCYALEETAEAMHYVRRGHASGKVIINIA